MLIRTRFIKMGRSGCTRDQRFDFSGYHAILKALKHIDFELAYLALLTHEGLKPLSRWEKPLDEKELELLRGMDLLTKQVQRRIQTGDDITETIFSRTPAYMDLYEEHFRDTPIDKSARTQRLEGFLFGYPPCCVDQYIKAPYAPNNLAEKDQEILLHWACKNCVITPVLLPAYRSLYDGLEHLT